MKKVLEKVGRDTLVVLLVLSFLSLVFISLINPESYLFGEKLSGEIATTYLLTGGIAGIIIAYLLFKKKNLSLGYGFLISPLSKMGLIISIVLLAIRKMK